MTGKQIVVKFHPAMVFKLLTGEKKCTSRGKPGGEPGDWFEVSRVVGPFTSETAKFRIISVEQMEYGMIKEKYYRCEGFFSPFDFEQFWVRIHRGHVPAAGELRWLHRLERME
jgi:hypothetical protein